MTTAQILAIALVLCAAADFILGYVWLIPKLRDTKDHNPMIEPLKRETNEKQRRVIKLIKAALDIWAVIALAFAYFLWNNPDSF